MQRSPHAHLPPQKHAISAAWTAHYKAEASSPAQPLQGWCVIIRTYRRVPTPPYVPLPLSLPRFSRKLDCRRLGLGFLAIRFLAQRRLHASITCALRRIPPGVLLNRKGLRTSVSPSQQSNARMPMATSAITTLYVSQLSLSPFLAPSWWPTLQDTGIPDNSNTNKCPAHPIDCSTGTPSRRRRDNLMAV